MEMSAAAASSSAGISNTSTAAPPIAMSAPSPNATANSTTSALLEGAAQLERMAARLASRAEHRLAASSTLLLLLCLIGVALIWLATRRATRRPAALPAAAHDVWMPVSTNADAPAGAALNRYNTGSRYNTFCSEASEEQAWEAAKRDWHAALARASRLEPSPARGATASVEEAVEDDAPALRDRL